MAFRIRTIKPEAFQSEQICRVSREARLLWVVLLTMSDDDGRLRWRTQSVLGHGFPEDDDAAGLLDGWLAELIDEGLVVFYRNGRSLFVVHPNWHDHQRIDKPKPSSLPGPDDPESTVVGSSQIDPGHTPPTPQDSSREEWKGREGKGMERIAAVRVPANAKPQADPEGGGDWFDRVWGVGYANGLWLVADYGPSRDRVAEMFREADRAVALEVQRDVKDIVFAGKVRGGLPELVRGCLRRAEREAAERVTAPETSDEARMADGLARMAALEAER